MTRKQKTYDYNCMCLIACFLAGLLVVASFALYSLVKFANSAGPDVKSAVSVQVVMDRPASRSQSSDVILLYDSTCPRCGNPASATDAEVVCQNPSCDAYGVSLPI